MFFADLLLLFPSAIVEVPDPSTFPNDGMEFNRYTLLGAHEVLMLALVRQRCLQDGLDPETELEEQLRAHINRGIGILYPRLKVSIRSRGAHHPSVFCEE